MYGADIHEIVNGKVELLSYKWETCAVCRANRKEFVEILLYGQFIVFLQHKYFPSICPLICWLGNTFI